MPLSATDKTKLKVLGALLIVAALVGYMRFGRQKSTDSAPDSALDTAPTVGTVMFSPADARKLLGGAIDTSVEDPPPPVRDIFSPPRTMPLMPPETNLAVPVSAELPPPAAAVPKGGGTILFKGLIRGRGKPRAFINDVVVGIGDKVEDFKLVEIVNDRIVLASSTQRVILKIGQTWSPP